MWPDLDRESRKIYIVKMKSYRSRVNPDSNITYVLIRRRPYEAKKHHEQSTI